MNRIDRITYNYNDALYCAEMLGGKVGEERAKRGFETFKRDIIAAAATGLSKEESTNLLEKTICLNSKAFLVALRVCNDFDAFSALLDTLEPKMVVLENPNTAGALRGLGFFAMVMSADTRGLPEATDFTRYKEMRAAMLERSNMPNGDVIRAVVAQFKNKFVADNSEENLQCRIM